MTFELGATVYRPTLETVKRSVECPDCHGTGKWEARSPAGDTYEIACPRCNPFGSGARSLTWREYTPYVEPFTVGAIEKVINEDGEKVQYMAFKSGGMTVKHTEVFATSEEAHARAVEIVADVAEKRGDWKKKRDLVEQLRHLNFKDAEIEAAKREARDAGQELDDLRAKICEAIRDSDGNHDEAIEEIKEIAEYNEEDYG